MVSNIADARLARRCVITNIKSDRIIINNITIRSSLQRLAYFAKICFAHVMQCPHLSLAHKLFCVCVATLRFLGQFLGFRSGSSCFTHLPLANWTFISCTSDVNMAFVKCPSSKPLSFMLLIKPRMSIPWGSDTSETCQKISLKLSNPFIHSALWLL